MSYSIPQKLKDELQNELINDDQELDVLQKKIKTRTLTNDSKNKENRKRAKIDVGYEMPTMSGQTLDNKEKDILLTKVNGVDNLLFFSDSDAKHFSCLLDNQPDTDVTKDERLKRQLMRLVLKVKNCIPGIRKQAMRTLKDKYKDFGASIVFENLLPILLDSSLNDQERHLMIKLMDRAILTLSDDVSKHVSQLLNAIGPLLLENESMVKTTGMDIIINLTTVVGYGTIIKSLKDDIAAEDDFIRNCAANILAVVTKTVGLEVMLPFFNALANTKKTWRIRHTGVRILHQSVLLIGSGVLAYLSPILKCLSLLLNDEQPGTKILWANTISLLAQYCFPHGMKAFEIVLETTWKTVKTSRGKLLSSHLRAMASIIPLMSLEYAGFYSKELMRILKREFNSPDENMKKTVLLVLQKCCKCESVTSKMIREDISEEFFKKFWIRRTALDIQQNKLVTFTTSVIAEKVGGAYCLEHLLGPLRDESEPLRIMAIHSVNKIVSIQGALDINDRLESLLVDSLLIAFQEQNSNDPIICQCLATLAVALDIRMKPYLAPIISTILNLLRHKSPQIRQNAADLCAALIPVISNCDEVVILNKLSIILYESLGEVYPEVLGAILAALERIVHILNIDTIQPPINQILPSLTPIFSNANRKVQMNTIRLVGIIALKGPSYAPPKEWMRICFKLLDLLKSTSKSIRRETTATFGYIAKAIGPKDIIVALLDNLKAQERQLRVSTSVAIAIVAKVCGPYTVIPALLNEYRTPETNVQNGILKAMTFMFEDIGELAKDYIYFLLPLLEDALMDRDLIHRQTAATIVRHLALHCSGTGFDDAFIHLLNLLIPNIFETSPHVIERILEGLEALVYAIGPSIFLNYIWAGLFHPAKKVRDAYWKLFNRIYAQQADSIVPAYPSSIRSKLDLPDLDLVL
ncbi:U2 snRNP component HSH155 [Nakaseomyces glabratus]|nr:U2 snRNP component HSH155 [Nakaseomyces glabratus]KTB14086.1 U2 snRNP component HSH155 [Nakaseomyces glabratus]